MRARWGPDESSIGDSVFGIVAASLLTKWWGIFFHLVSDRGVFPRLSVGGLVSKERMQAKTLF